MFILHSTTSRSIEIYGFARRRTVTRLLHNLSTEDTRVSIVHLFYTNMIISIFLKKKKKSLTFVHAVRRDFKMSFALPGKYSPHIENERNKTISSNVHRK